MIIMEATQLSFFANAVHQAKKKKRSGTFLDNMKLPVHRWFRYSAGFSAEWIETLLTNHIDQPNYVVLDPFVGSGTTLLASDKMGVSSIGIEAHPFVARIAQAKLLWSIPVSDFVDQANSVLCRAKQLPATDLTYPKLIYKCFGDESLTKLDQLKRAWAEEDDNSPESQLAWLALTSILRPSSKAGTAQWQYILPNKSKKVVAEPFDAYELQIRLMKADMASFQRAGREAQARFIQGDARHFPLVEDNTIDLVMTSPPYANNYDYADATRFEMSFWGEVRSWGDLHQTVRQYLIRSCSQHASKEKLVLQEVLQAEILTPIHTELIAVCNRLAEERLKHGGKKHYHTMVAAYFLDMAKVWHELRRVCKQDAKVCFVIGDSAPYGVYLPVDKWLGQLALAAGFRSYRFEKLRDRNIKWKNRTHRVPLHEGRLWVEG